MSYGRHMISDDSLKILYVDDQDAMLTIAKDFLEVFKGFDVDTTESAIEALVLLEENNYDIIVSDYEMPIMDGITFLKKLNSTFQEKKPPFIIFTGVPREEIEKEAFENGAAFYLHKGSTNFSELCCKIEMAAGRKVL